MTLYNIVKELLTENNKTLDAQTIIEFSKPVLLHVIGAYSAYECQRNLKDFITSDANGSAQKFRLRLSGMSYIHLNLKYFMLNVMKRSNYTGDDIRQWMRDFSVSEQDAKLVVRVVKCRGIKGCAKKVLSEVKTSEIDAAAFRNVYATFKEIYPDISRHIKSRTYKKLRFLSVSCNIEFHDFNMELMCKALQTYIRMVPTRKSPLHVANYIRNSINNHVTNMIKSGTAQKRARMVKGGADGFGGDRFDILTVSENQLQHALGVEDTVSYENLQDINVNAEEEYKNLSELNFERLLRRFGTTTKKRVLLELVACCEHKAFTKWLQKHNRIKEHEDNVDFNDRIGFKLYLRNVCEFLNVCESRVLAFIKNIGNQAYPDKVGP